MLKTTKLRQKLNERLHKGKAQRADEHIAYSEQAPEPRAAYRPEGELYFWLPLWTVRRAGLGGFLVVNISFHYLPHGSY